MKEHSSRVTNAQDGKPLHIVDVETASKDTNGGRYEADPPDVCAEAKFTVSKRPSAVDGNEHPYPAPLLSQRDWPRVDGDATADGCPANYPATISGIVFSQPFSIAGSLVRITIWRCGSLPYR